MELLADGDVTYLEPFLSCLVCYATEYFASRKPAAVSDFTGVPLPCSLLERLKHPGVFSLENSLL